MKSMPFLPLWGFSILIILLFMLVSCKFHLIADYSFRNELEEDVELYLYISHKYYSQKIGPYHLIPAGTAVKLLTKESNDREDSFGHDYFHRLIDSVRVKISGQEYFIAVWRQDGVYDLAEGYETLHDFYNSWPWVYQHAGTHAEYEYSLKLKEE